MANLPLLSQEFGCYYEGELVVVAGLPGLGKTAFLSWLSLNISKTQPLLWIPCNASAEYATMRFLLSSSGKSFEWMQEPNSDAFLDALLQLRNHQIFVGSAVSAARSFGERVREPEASQGLKSGF